MPKGAKPEKAEKPPKRVSRKAADKANPKAAPTAAGKAKRSQAPRRGPSSSKLGIKFEELNRRKFK